MNVYRNGVLVCGVNNNIAFANVQGNPKDNVLLKKELEKSVIQTETIPVAKTELNGVIYQYIGATTGAYTNGYFYKCVFNTTTGNYEWINLQVQPVKVDDNTISINTDDKLEVKDAGINNSKLADDSVTIDKISDTIISTTIPDSGTGSDDKLPTEKAVKTKLDLKLNKADITVATTTGVVTITY